MRSFISSAFVSFCISSICSAVIGWAGGGTGGRAGWEGCVWLLAAEDVAGAAVCCAKAAAEKKATHAAVERIRIVCSCLLEKAKRAEGLPRVFRIYLLTKVYRFQSKKFCR